MENFEKIVEFESLLRSTNRKGIEDLLKYIQSTNFYNDPASTVFHSCHEGGLLEHSLYVYKCLKAKKDEVVWKKKLSDIPDESLIIIGLLHDLCKANTYKVEYRNKKVYSPTGKKYDEQGNYDWQSVPAFVNDDQEPLGHGEKSVILAMKFIELTDAEMYAIRWHMLFTDYTFSGGGGKTVGSAVEKYPVILAVSEADLEATYLFEKKE